MKQSEYWQSYFVYFNKKQQSISLSELSSQVTVAIAAKDFFTAKVSAETAAAKYYVPGLILLIQVKIAECKQLEDEGVTCESNLAPCYATFIMCKKLITEMNEPPILKELLAEMKALGLTEDMQAEQEALASQMIDRMRLYPN